MMGIPVFSEGMIAFYAFILVALVVLVSLIRSLTYILSQPPGRVARIKRVARMWAAWIAGAAILWTTVNYWNSAELRSKAHDCRKTSSEGGRYTAELCLLQWIPGDDSIYLGRVYNAKNSELLVERTFSTPVPELSWWKEKAVSFAKGGDDSSWVALPPSLYDRLLAKLP
jgi:hypothetical protein